jgi:hypothetical protein
MAFIKDGDWRLFDYDFSTGRQVWVLHHDDGAMTFRTDYPADATIDVNTAQRNMARPDWKGDYHLVASIPPNIFYDQLDEASRQKDDRFISKWLNDSDNSAWRTKGGRV